MTKPNLDHVVIDVRDEIDAAAALFEHLGFTLTDRGYHTLGSANHLAVFGSNYLELLGWEKGSAETRAELAPYPIGLNGLVFRTNDASALYADLRKRGLPAREPLAFSRPVRLPNGADTDARFRTVRFDTGTFGGMRTYFCQHLTPELVWRDPRQAHPNGALDIIAAVVCARRPERLRALFATMFDAEDVPGLRIVTPERLSADYRAAAPELCFDESMAALTIRTSSMAAVADTMRAGGIAVEARADRIIVPAKESMNVTLEFVE